MRWIAKDRTGESLLASEVELRHVWSTAQAYREQVGAAIGARRDAWSELLGRLVAAGALEAERVPTIDPIEVVVEDHRDDRSTALPALR